MDYIWIAIAVALLIAGGGVTLAVYQLRGLERKEPYRKRPFGKVEPWEK
jgi:hypothetical protein